MIKYPNSKKLQKYKPVYLAVQNSSIGDLVTHSVRVLLLLTFNVIQSDPRDL